MLDTIATANYDKQQRLKRLAFYMGSYRSRASNMQAGMTYLGQFISHDIVPPTTPKAGGRKVSAHLALDSIYNGKDPERLFSVHQRQVRSFGQVITNYDLDRDVSSGLANIPEHRNDENVIVAQLHAFFQRLHNTIYEGVTGCHAEARILTIKTFQLLVLEEFLQDILAPSVYDACGLGNARFIPGRDPNEIPDLFSKAGFRFGHSIVRNSYTLRGNLRATSLASMFSATNSLAEKHIIDWKRFFGKRAQRAAKIDFGVSPPMRKVDFPLDSAKPIDVTLLNLLAGQRVNLPTGHAFFADLASRSANGLTPVDLGLERIDQYSDSLTFLDDIYSPEALPLWPYLLVEAHMGEGKGNHLGTMGSIIVAEVIRDAIRSAQTSVIENDRYDFESAVSLMGDWGMTLELQGSNHANGPRLTMENLLAIVN